MFESIKRLLRPDTKGRETVIPRQMEHRYEQRNDSIVHECGRRFLRNLKHSTLDKVRRLDPGGPVDTLALRYRDFDVYFYRVNGQPVRPGIENAQLDQQFAQASRDLVTMLEQSGGGRAVDTLFLEVVELGGWDFAVGGFRINRVDGFVSGSLLYLTSVDGFFVKVRATSQFYAFEGLRRLVDEDMAELASTWKGKV